jgi:3-phenylpropionate/trans-cinnamate dioxygenase ferredoxin subunit
MSAQPAAEDETFPGFTLVCRVDDLAPGTAAQAEVDGVIVAMVRDGDGGIHALDDRCSHADVSLSEGEVDGCTLECWLHGSRFDVRTGESTGPPATLPVPVYPVKIDGDHVYVNTRGAAPPTDPPTDPRGHLS